ncbi:MAG: DHHW family protein, partial [Butyricicoccus sp.]|nr:DHHW family protein [Butyricicoccus sp.]
MKKRDLPLVIGFCAVLIGLQAAFWLMPKQEFSVNEKRVLQELPELRWSSLWSGKWFQSIDDYLSDHFAKRDFWVGIHAYTQQAEGLNAAGQVYRGKDGWLINRPVEAGTVFEKNVQVIQDFAASHAEEKMSFLCIPTTGAIMTDKLPDLHDSYPDAALLQQMKTQYGDKMQWIDGMEALQGAADAPIYYRTDHHWTSLGAYQAYRALANAWGLIPAKQDEYAVQEYDGFYGTTYSKSGLWATPPDTIS